MMMMIMKYRNGIVFILGILVMALSRGGEAKREAPKPCLEGCKPICLNLEGALDTTCDLACYLGCTQLLGKGKRNSLIPERTPDGAPAPDSRPES